MRREGVVAFYMVLLLHFPADTEKYQEKPGSVEPVAEPVSKYPALSSKKQE
jgi:hypothetical protein